MNHITNHSDRKSRSLRSLLGAQGGEVVRFALVGATATAIQYVVYLVLLQLAHCGVNVANTVGYAVSFVFNFLASTRYTFRVRATAGRGLAFAFCHLVNYLLQIATLNLFVAWGLSKQLAPLPMFAVCVPVNFLMVRYFLKRAQTLRNPFYIFRIKRDERWVALAALIYGLLANALVLCAYWLDLSQITGNYKKVVTRVFHISGFDPISYLVLTDWSAGYNIYRHPLLAFFMWIPCQINQGLMALTGVNCSMAVMAVILVFCCVYSAVFLWRILREIIGLAKTDTALLIALFFSFGYTMVIVSVPDHFCLSMFMLILTLYVAGKKMKAKHLYTKWQTVLFFVLTAGISLNNGIKVFLASLFTNGRRFWRPAHLLLAVILPSALIWVAARQEWKALERPNYLARQAKKKAQAERDRERIAKAFRDTTQLTDSTQIAQGIDRVVKQKIRAKYIRDHKKAWNLHKGKPINQSEFGSWTDISTPRGESLVENIFGEPIQIHQDYTLLDALVNRPVIVGYRWIWNYVVEGVVALLFVAGIWCGRRNRYLWLSLSFFGFDMVIHFVLGFGLNEVYIMSPHWLFIIPIAVAYFVQRAEPIRWRLPLRLLLGLLAVYLAVWNAVLYVGYML